MERLSIDELIAHCDRQLERLPSGNKFYQEHESTRAYLQELRHYKKTGLEPEDITCAFTADTVVKLAAQVLSTTPARLRELAQADQRHAKALIAEIENLRVFNRQSTINNTRLIAEVQQLTKERDAAVADIEAARGVCRVCRHNAACGNPIEGYCDGERWEWRGPQKEAKRNG